ncbi:hypothetical protein SMD44_06632 [Streptomyces alboflavus]|uniref:Uncharacterized protein n=1 Tax=Streptomyces alboflavus TaxID=67267 RepID=A0A1Z1WL23_9ACTN|nr:hypothetical protein SMD44_06632 [Streptomyces alboflavus]
MHIGGQGERASTIAPSLSTLPGETSRRCAIRSRVTHSSRTTAICRRRRTLCMPDVRRQGSLRGGAGGAEAMASNSSRAHSSFPCRSSSFSRASRRSTSSSTSSAAYRSQGSGRGRGRPVDGGVALLQDVPEDALDHGAEPDPGESGEPSGELRVEDA